jgi:hypothetical protein
MSVLPICVHMVIAQHWFSILIHLGRPSSSWRELKTRRHRSWTAAQAIPAIRAQVVDKLLPTVACLLPVYEPVLVALIISSIMLAGRVSPG